MEDVAHEEDLRRIRPLEAVVPFDGAVNWSSHHGTDRGHAPAAHKTRCMSVELKRPVFHTNTNLAEAKRERLFTRSEQHQRGLPRSRSAQSQKDCSIARQLPHAWETQVVEDDVHGVIAQGIEDVLHMVVHHDTAPSPFTKTMPSPVDAVITVPAPRALASWTPMKPVPPWPAITTTVGFEVQGAPASCRHCKLVPPTMGIVPASPNDSEKGLSVVRLQVVKAYWAYPPCTMPHTSEPYIRSQSSLARHVCAGGPRGTPEPSQMGSTKSTSTGFTLLPNTLTRA